jgi:hypothetical protein
MDQGDCELALATYPGGKLQRSKVMAGTAVPYANDNPLGCLVTAVRLQAFGIDIAGTGALRRLRVVDHLPTSSQPSTPKS